MKSDVPGGPDETYHVTDIECKYCNRITPVNFYLGHYYCRQCGRVLGFAAEEWEEEGRRHKKPPAITAGPVNWDMKKKGNEYILLPHVRSPFGTHVSGLVSACIKGCKKETGCKTCWIEWLDKYSYGTPEVHAWGCVKSSHPWLGGRK